MGFPEILLRLSAVELAQLYWQRDLSPVEVIRAVLTRSVQRQADLNAFAFLDEAGALAAARAELAVRGLSAAQRAQLDLRLERTGREGERLFALDYVAAEAARATYAADIDAFFTSVDLFLTPTMPQVAPRIDQTVPPPPPRSNPFSLSRHPAISVPCGLSREHLPIGLQIVGWRYEDEFVLASAQAFETHAAHLQDFRLRAQALRT